MNSIRGENYSLVYQCKCAVKTTTTTFWLYKISQKIAFRSGFSLQFPSKLSFVIIFFSKTEKMLKTFHLFLAHPVVLQLIVPSMEQLSKIAK